MTEREMFEAWLFAEFPGANDFVLVFRPDENRYEHQPTQARWEAWQASANREGYKLVPVEATNKMIVAIENKVQEQLDASAITADMFRLDGERIFEAMINAID